MEYINNYRLYQRGLIYNGAPHTEIELTDNETLLLLKHYHGFFIRNVFNWDCETPTSFWYIIQDQPIRLEDLHSKCRNQVRKAYKTLIINKIDKLGVINGGYEVYEAAFRRYKIKTSIPLSREQWERNVKNAPENMEYWGTYERESGKLIAYAEVLIQSNAVKYTALKAIPEYMNKTYPFYGLLFEMNKYYIEDEKMLYVTDGARSITEHSNIQSFLEKFNFRRAYCHLRVTYVWWLKMVINILYPFRKLFGNSKLGYLLRFEAINRNEY